MKEGDIVIYKGKNYQERVGKEATILEMDDWGDDDIIWVLEFEDGVKHSCRESFLKLHKENNKKKIKNLEVDPFGEEIWGFVQENLSWEEFPLNNCDIIFNDQWEFKEMMNMLEKNYNFHWFSGGSPTQRNFDGYSKITLMDGVLTRNLNGKEKYKYSDIVDLLLSKGKKKIKNLEVDPFGEENWGFVQESLEPIFKVGDIVRINRNKVPNNEDDKKYYDKSKGGEGEIFQIIEIFGKFPYRVRWNYKDNQGRYAEDELELVNDKRKRIRKPNEDPFDEENWGYVQESRGDNFFPGETVLYQGQRNEYYGQNVKIVSRTHRLNYMILFQDGNEYECGTSYLTKTDEKGMTRKKITKPDIDPFGEEAWYSVQENSKQEFSFIPYEKFRELRYDRDAYFDYMKKTLMDRKISFVAENIWADDYGSDYFIGKITDVRDCSENKEDKGIRIELKIEGYPEYHTINIYKKIIIRDKSYTKITNSEIDPFGEEEWGYVQESFNPNDNIAIYTKNGEEFDNLMMDLERDGFTWAGQQDSPTKEKYHKNKEVVYLNLYEKGKLVYSDLNYFKNHFEVHNNYKLINYEKNEKKYRKLENPEIDPFGEENWGYVQESAEYVGNKVFVTNKLKYYIDKYGWIECMKDFIGTQIIPTEFKPNHRFPSNFITDIYVYRDWYIPADCLSLTNDYKKITRLDIDPFGEEIW